MTPTNIANLINDGRGVLRFTVILILSIALILIYYMLVTKISDINSPEEFTLPLLTIGGVIVLVLVLTLVAAIFSLIGLGTPGQAMGLPEGSIRAVIALSLIVLFAILAIYLYGSVSTGQLNTIDNLSDADRSQFFKDHPAIKDLQAAVKKNADNTPTNFYQVAYHSTNSVTGADDFAQLLVLLGTLMTAITSFYSGAGTATSAAAAAAAPPLAPSPTISGIDPKTHSNAAGTIHLQIIGANLNPITHVKIVKSGVEIMGTEVSSSPIKVIGYSRQHEYPDWNVGRCRRRWRVEICDFARGPHDHGLSARAGRRNVRQQIKAAEGR